jgi:hypothetical protein
MKMIRVLKSFARFVDKRLSQNILRQDSVQNTEQRSEENPLSGVSGIMENGIAKSRLLVKRVGEFFIGHPHTPLFVLNSVEKSINLLEPYLRPVPVAVPCSWRQVQRTGFVRRDVSRDIFMRKVVDIEVEGVHEFVAKGLVAHNCVFMHGQFLAIAKGRVLGDFSWERNYLEYDLDNKLDPEEWVFIGQDFNTGFSRASAYIARDGVIYAVKYYDFANVQDAPSVFRHDFPHQRILWIPDMTMKDSFPMFTRELRRYDIRIAYRKKNPVVEDTVFLCNKLFYTGRLRICAIAKDLAEACALAMRDKDNRIPKGLGPSSPIHAIDGLRYAVHFICANRPGFRDIRNLVLDKLASLRDEEEDPVKRLQGGYLEIAPGALAERRGS